MERKLRTYTEKLQQKSTEKRCWSDFLKVGILESGQICVVRQIMHSWGGSEHIMQIGAGFAYFHSEVGAVRMERGDGRP